MAQSPPGADLPGTWQNIWHHEQSIPVWSLPSAGALDQGVVILIHGEDGLNEATRAFAFQVSTCGYRVLVPDWTMTHAHPEAERQRSSATSRAELLGADTRRLMSGMKKVLQHADSLRQGSGRMILMGVGWGGTQAFELATQTPLPELTVVIDGEGPKIAAQCARISAPVYGFFSASEKSRLQRIRALDRYMIASGKTFEAVVYEGAEADFMLRPAEQQTQGSKHARDQAFERLQAILAQR